MSSASSKPKLKLKAKPAKAQAEPNTAVPAAVETPRKSSFFSLPWGPGAAIIVTVVAFFLSQVLGAVLVGILPLSLGWTQDQLAAWIDSVGGQFVFVVVAEALTVLTLWWFLRRRRVAFRLIGFLRKPLWTDLGYALAGFGVYFVLLIVATAVARSLLSVDVDQQQELGFSAVASGLDRLMVFISLVVLPPVVEEIIFRGFLYGGLRTKLQVWPATLITSALFAAPHLLAAKNGGLLWIAAIDTFVLSLVLCHLREKTGNIWAGIGVHALKNGLAFIFLFVLGPISLLSD